MGPRNRVCDSRVRRGAAGRPFGLQLLLLVVSLCVPLGIGASCGSEEPREAGRAVDGGVREYRAETGCLSDAPRDLFPEPTGTDDGEPGGAKETPSGDGADGPRGRDGGHEDPAHREVAGDAREGAGSEPPVPVDGGSRDVQGFDGLVPAGGGTFSGSVGGVTISPVREVFHVDYGSRMSIVYSDFGRACDLLNKSSKPNPPFALFSIFTPHRSPGIYPIGTTLAQTVVGFTFVDKAGRSGELQATGGKLILTTVSLGSKPEVAGSFTATFSGTATVSGTFHSVTECSVQTTPPPPRDGGVAIPDGPPPPPPDLVPPRRCSTDADCPPPTCSESGGTCYGAVSVCQSGSCVWTKSIVRGGRCDKVTGSCR